MPAKSKAVRDTLYLQRIGERWHWRVPVPSRLCGELGPYVRKTLDTSDLNEARKRRRDALTVLKARIEATARRLGLASGSPEGARERSYEAFRSRLGEAGPVNVVNAHDGEEITNPAIDAIIDEAERSGVADDAEFLRAYQDHATGALAASALLADYLAKNPKRSKTTEANYATTVRLWIEHHGDHSLRDVRRSKALEWLNAVAEGKAGDTIKRYVAVMSNLWLWSFRAVDHRPANPFEGLAQAADERGREAKSYGHFSDDELVRAYQAVIDDDELRPAFLISIYTGLRLNECLTAADSDEGARL